MRKIISLFLVLSICVSQTRPIYAVGFDDDESFNCFSIVKSFFSKKPDDDSQHIEGLPKDCLVHVLTYLNRGDLSRLRSTDVFFKNLIDDESKFQVGRAVPDLGCKHANPMIELDRKLEQLSQYEQIRDKNAPVRKNVHDNSCEYGESSVKAYELMEQRKRWNKADCFGKMRYVVKDDAFVLGGGTFTALAIFGVAIYFNGQLPEKEGLFLGISLLMFTGYFLYALCGASGLTITEVGD